MTFTFSAGNYRSQLFRPLLFCVLPLLCFVSTISRPNYWRIHCWNFEIQPGFDFTNNWPAPPHDPQGIRVASVFEFSDCVFSDCLFVLCKFSHFLQYSTVQYSTVQYGTVQYSTVQYCTVHYSTVQYIQAVLASRELQHSLYWLQQNPAPGTDNDTTDRLSSHQQLMNYL